MGGWETSNPAKFLPFHFVKLASLTSLVKDNFDLYSLVGPGLHFCRWQKQKVKCCFSPLQRKLVGNGANNLPDLASMLSNINTNTSCAIYGRT